MSFSSSDFSITIHCEEFTKIYSHNCFVKFREIILLSDVQLKVALTKYFESKSKILVFPHCAYYDNDDDSFRGRSFFFLLCQNKLFSKENHSILLLCDLTTFCAKVDINGSDDILA